MFYGVFIAEEIDGLGEKRSGHTQHLMCRHIWMSCWICSWDMSVSLLKLFLVKNQTSGLGTILLKCQVIGISGLSDDGVNEFCCSMN